MKEREELELILKLIGKYNLPLSPILEYAVKEKMEEYPEESTNQVVSSLETSPETDSHIENRKGKPWTSEEEDTLIFDFRQGKDFFVIAQELGRTELAIKSRLGKLGIIDFTYDDESNSEFRIENDNQRCSIIDRQGNRLFTTEGKLKSLNGTIYRFYLSKKCFTVKVMQNEGGKWGKGISKIVAYPSSKLYKVLDNALDYIDAVEDIEDSYSFRHCRLKVYGQWYSSVGNVNSSKEINKIKVTDNNENVKEDASDDELVRASRTKANLGDWIQWKPTEEIGKVIAFRDDGGVRKMLVRKKNKYEIEVTDNPNDYDILLNKKKVATYEAAINKNERASNSVEIKNDSVASSVKIGDWIKTNFFNDKCQVVMIENNGSLYEKLIVQFRDGHRDWIINKPEIYTIVEQ